MVTVALAAGSWALFWHLPVFLEDDGPSVAVRLGLTPAALSAAGCDEAVTDAIFSAIEQSPQEIAQLSQLDSEWETQASSVAGLVDLIRDPAGCTDEQVQQCATAQSELAQVESDLQGVVGTLRATALSVCPPEVAVQAEKLVEARDEPAVPVRVFAREMTAEDREEYAVAVDMERVAAEREEEPDQQFQDTIVGVEDDQAVQDAQQNLEENLDEVSDAFEGPG